MPRANLSGYVLRRIWFFSTDKKTRLPSLNFEWPANRHFQDLDALRDDPLNPRPVHRSHPSRNDRESDRTRQHAHTIMPSMSLLVFDQEKNRTLGKNDQLGRLDVNQTNRRTFGLFSGFILKELRDTRFDCLDLLVSLRKPSTKSFLN